MAGSSEHVSRSSSALLSRVQVVPTSDIVQTERETSWFGPRQRLTLFTGADTGRDLVQRGGHPLEDRSVVRHVIDLGLDRSDI